MVGILIFIYIRISNIKEQKPPDMLKPLSITDQIKIDELTTQIKQLYKELKDCDHKPIQSTIIWSLKPKCQQLLQLLTKGQQLSQYMIKKKQILDIRKKIEQVENKLKQEEELNPQIGFGGRMNKLNDKNYTQEQLEAQLRYQSRIEEKLGELELPEGEIYRKNRNSMEVDEKNVEMYQKQLYRSSVKLLRDITIQEMEINQVKYTQEELNQILKRLENNQQVMKNVENLIISQGNNTNKIGQNLQHAYTNLEEMNVDLGQAQKEQIKAVNKIRAGIQKCAMGFWGFLSWPFKKIFKKRKPKSSPVPNVTPILIPD